ncbi:hypothetical protein DsansV1_C07g0071291 [Dioscorea sansibarensis]
MRYLEDKLSLKLCHMVYLLPCQVTFDSLCLPSEPITRIRKERLQEALNKVVRDVVRCVESIQVEGRALVNLIWANPSYDGPTRLFH